MTAGLKYNVTAGNGFEALHNTFVGNSIGMYIDYCGGAAVLKNNLFYSANPAQTHLYVARAITSGGSDYNCFYEHGGNVIGWVLSAFPTVAAFTSATTLDSHSIGSNPSFVSSSDFHLAASSPCVGLGTVTDVTLDYDGNPFSAASPSIGAFK